VASPMASVGVRKSRGAKLEARPSTAARTSAKTPPYGGSRARREDSALVAWYRSLTHLAREGRMTVTIGRRELLAALGGAVATLPLVARAQQPGKLPTIGFMGPRNVARGSPRSPHGGDLGQYRQPRLRPGNGRGSGGGPHAGLSTQLPRTALVSGR